MFLPAVESCSSFCFRIHAYYSHGNRDHSSEQRFAFLHCMGFLIDCLCSSPFQDDIFGVFMLRMKSAIKLSFLLQNINEYVFFFEIK